MKKVLICIALLLLFCACAHFKDTEQKSCLWWSLNECKQWDTNNLK